MAFFHNAVKRYSFHDILGLFKNSPGTEEFYKALYQIPPQDFALTSNTRVLNQGKVRAKFSLAGGECMTGKACFSLDQIREIREKHPNQNCVLFTKNPIDALDAIEEFKGIGVVMVGYHPAHFVLHAQKKDNASFLVMNDEGEEIKNVILEDDYFRQIDPPLLIKKGQAVTIDTERGFLFDEAFSIEEIYPEVSNLFDCIKRIANGYDIRMPCQVDTPEECKLCDGDAFSKMENSVLPGMPGFEILKRALRNPEGNQGELVQATEAHFSSILKAGQIDSLTVRLMDLQPDQICRNPLETEELRQQLKLDKTDNLRGFEALKYRDDIQIALVTGLFLALEKHLPQDASFCLTIPDARNTSYIDKAVEISEKAKEKCHSLYDVSITKNITFGAFIENGSVIENSFLPHHEQESLRGIAIKLKEINPTGAAPISIGGRDLEADGKKRLQALNKTNPFEEIDCYIRGLLSKTREVLEPMGITPIYLGPLANSIDVSQALKNIYGMKVCVPVNLAPPHRLLLLQTIEHNKPKREKDLIKVCPPPTISFR